jgi:acyl-CoA synthetase (NDP forming)
MTDGTRLEIDAWLNTTGLDDVKAPTRLNEVECYGLLSTAGIDTCAYAFLPVQADDEAKAAWCQGVRELLSDDGRFVLKIVGRTLLHKSDIDGVTICNLDAASTDDTILNLAETMLKAVRAHGVGSEIEGLVACGFVSHKANLPGQELLISIKQDEAFGPVIVVGVGGVLTEWYGKATGGRSKLIFPVHGLTQAVIADALFSHPVLSIMTQASRLHKAPPIELETLASRIMALAKLATVEIGDDTRRLRLDELEINPAVISAGSLVAIDGVGLVSRHDSASRSRPLHKIKNLLQPNSALIMGVSAKGQNPGRIIMNNLRQSPGVDADKLYVMHPREEAIDGIKCVADPALIPGKVDLAVVCIPAEGARDAIARLVELDKAESIILIPGGFAEAGHTGLAQEIIDCLAAGHAQEGGGPVMVGGNCLGIVSRDQYNTFFLPDYKLPFAEAEQGRNLAIVSQSGAYLVTFASNYDGVINPRASISYGNQMDLTVADFLEHFLSEPEVDVIACYIEGFQAGDGQRFIRLLGEARKAGKQVIVFKAGKTPLGAKAAASHTASLAGDYAIAQSCMVQSGAVVCDTLDEFEDMIKIFTLLAGRKVNGRRVGVMSNAGFECSTVTDALHDLKLQPFAADVKAALDEVLPSFAHRENPVDATPMAGTDAYAASVAAIIASDQVDCAILSSVPVTQALNNLPPSTEGRHREDITADESQPQQYIRILAGADKPAVVVIDSGVLYDPMVNLMENAGIPVFRKIDRASKALDRFVSAHLD